MNVANKATMLDFIHFGGSLLLFKQLYSHIFDNTDLDGIDNKML